MAEALSRRAHDVHVVTYHLGETGAAAPFHIHRIPEVKAYRKYTSGPTYQKLLVLDTLLTMKLLHVVREMQIDIIHTYHYEGLLTASFLQRRIKLPVVYDAHTLLESEFPFYMLGLPKPSSDGSAVGLTDGCQNVQHILSPLQIRLETR